MKTKATILAALLAAAGMAQGRTIALDLRGQDSVSGDGMRRAALRSAAPADPDGRRTSLPSGAADVGEVSEGDVLDLTLFDGVEVALRLAEASEAPFGGEAFLAKTSGSGGALDAVVLRTEDGLTVDVRDLESGRVYKVVSSPSGVTVEEIVPKGESICGHDALEPPPAGDSAGVAPSVSGVRSAAADADSFVDVLVAYDRNAAAWTAQNGGGVTNFAQVSVQRMNAVLANTGLSESFRFRLVGVTTLEVSEDDVHEALYAINREDAGWKKVKTVREEVGADIVTTLIDTGSAYGTTGVGWSLSSTSSLATFGDSAYNVCAVRSVAQSETLAHECGHNLGAGHATLQETQPGPQLYDYSAGHYFTGTNGTRYCTVMAYGDEGPGGTSAPYFSSPDHAFMGASVGDAKHDNTRTLAETFAYAANWRAQKVPTSYSVSFSPESGTLFDGSLSIALSPGKSGAEIRYTLDGSDPTPASPLYTGPVRLTTTTTIRASTVADGVCSIPFEASYYSKDDIGYAMGLPEFDWTRSVPATSLCGVQTTNTVDGAAIGATVAYGDVCSIFATMNGPATILWKSMGDGNVRFRVMCDGAEVFKESWGGYSWDWAEKSADIPAGTHRVEFRLESGYGTTWYWLDDFRVFFVSKPAFSPATTASASTAAEFTGETMVSLERKSDDDIVFYTLDGSDPNDAGAILYDGPFFLTESALVRAVATRPGVGSSPVAEGLYLERHAVGAGEWTLDGTAAYSAAQADGRMIAELCWNYPGCGWSKALEPVMTDPAFTAWAALNGVYLPADSWGDKVGATGGRFWNLYGQTPLSDELRGFVYYPTFVFSSPGDEDTALGAMLARNDGKHTVNGLLYEGTVESLIAGFASFLTPSAPPAAPVASAADANGRTFPFSVTLSNPNEAGTIYYTLDGSLPTRENGIRYTGPISIPRSGTTLKAVVWPSDSSAVSGVPLVVAYESLVDALYVDGVTWQNDAAVPWTVSSEASGTVLNGGKKLDLQSGSVTSTLKATVQGPGTFHFKYYLYIWYTSLSLRMNGTTLATWSSDANAETNIVVSSAGTTELEWIYTYPYSENAYAQRSKCQLSEISWSPHAAPASVSGLTASGGTYADGTVLRWTEADNADAYVVYRGETADPAAATRIGTTERNRLWDFSGELGKTYYYWVSSSNAWGEGPLAGPVAGWSPPGWTVSFDPNGGNGSMPERTVARGKTATLPACGFSRTGWSFAGWATSAVGSVSYADGARIAPTSDTTLYAKWTANAYAISFDRQGGSGGSASATATYGSAMPSISAPTRAGYAFGGYWTEPNGLGTQYYTAAGASARSWDIASATTLYAKWTPRTYAVTLNLQGGAGGATGATATYGSPMPSITPPTRDGYTFGGYYTAANGGGTQYYTASGDSARDWDKTSATTLYAKWTGNRYDVSFDHQGGEGGATSATATFGSAMPAVAIPTLAGYAFVGYWSETNGAGTQYYTASGASAHVWDRTCAATLYAQWALPQYTVKFAANGGAGTMPAQTISRNKWTKLSANKFARSGWVFLGWAKTKAGAVAYANGAAVKNLAAVGGTATLYAVWAKKAYKVKFVANGGKGKMADQKMTYGKAKKLSANKFKRDGYVFKGWATSKANAKKGKVAYKNKKSVKNLVATGKTVKLYAVWKKKR